MAHRLNGVIASIRAGLARLAGLARGSRRDREFADEIEAHLQMHIDDLTRAGLAPDRARRQARLKFGGIESIRETHRDRRGVPLIDRLAQDVRDAVRVLRRSPGFASVAILSLALGIGANTAIFSIVSAVMIRPLPVPESDRLVQLSPGTNRDNWSRPLWEQIRDRPELFESVFAWSESSLNLAERGEVRPARAILASGRFFETLRVVPMKGRLLLPSDDVRGGGPEGAVTVISYRFWQAELAGAADVVGRSIALNRVPFTIVGVTPPGFSGPRVGRDFDVVVAMGALPLLRPDATAMLSSRTTWWLSVMARLRPDQTMASAASSLAAVSPAVREATLPSTYGPEAVANYLKGGLQIRSAPGGPAGLQRTYERPLFVLLGVTGIVLLLCCVNIANLLLARSAARRHEVAVRLALGASRWRLIQQMLVESLILAVAGALIALAIARAGSGWLVQQLSTTANAIHLDLAIDWRVLLFTTLVAVVVAVLFGCVPALRASEARPTDALRDSTRIVRGEARFGFGSALVVVQVALSLVLVVAAGLFVRTFTSLAQKPLGFDRDPVLTVAVNAQRSAVPAANRGALFERVRQAAASVPGVASAALAAIVPVNNTQIDRPIENPDGMSLDEGQRSAFWNYVSHDWFATYGIPMRSGRDFGPLDAAPAPQTIVVNETFARRFFRGANPIGRTVRVQPGPGEPNPPMTIVGVVGDAVYDSLRDAIPPTIYQSVSQAGMSASISLSVRAASSAPASLGPAVSEAIMAVDNDLSLTLRVLGDQIDASIARERVLARLSAVFGAVGLLLAAIGLFGVMSHAVARRRAEIGLRMSLGATPAAIVGLVARRVFILVASGVIAGGVLSVWTAGLVETLLFDVAPGSPLVLAGAIGVLALVAGAASAVPAWRAAHVDPTTALRGS